MERAKGDDMDLGLDRLLSLDNARLLGEELACATDDELRANRVRLTTLESAIVQCEKVRQRVDHAQLVYVGAFLKTGAWRMHGMRTAADWVAWRLGLEGRTARERVRVAQALEGLPKTEAAFAAGEIGYTKVRAVTRVADRDTEGQWLERASLSSADRFERECREAPGPVGPEEEGPPRWIVTRTRPDGLVQTTVVLPPEEHALWFKGLDAAIAIAHGSRKTASSASLDGLTGSDGPAGSDGPTGSDGPRRFGRVDALLAVSNQFLASQPSPASSPGRYEVLVRVDSEVLAGQRLLCELADGPPLLPETVRRLSCDASKVVYRTDEADYPLDVDRRTRTITPALKRALLIRDDCRCRFPGCGAHLFVEGHHLRHWADGGATSLENLILLCSRCHTWTHEGGGRVTLDEDGGAVFTNAFGERLPELSPTLEAA